MFDTLLESRSRKEAHAGGTIARVTAHTALIAAAVFATAQARVKPGELPAATRLVYLPSQQSPMSPATTDKPRRALAEQPSLPRIELRQVDLNVPSIEIGNSLNASVEFAPRPLSGGISNGIESSPRLDGVFEANQVEKQVSVIGSATPRYPEVLRASGVEGRVTAEFVVDERGRAETDSVRFVGSDNQLFEEAVKAVLPRMRFAAAEVGGRKVRQLVRMPFVFKLGR